MPKLERLEWVAHLNEGKGVTLTDDPAADAFLAEDPNALLLGVLYDSQFATRRAFAIPLLLKERLGHLDMNLLANEDITALKEAFNTKPSLHRFPNRNAELTQKVAKVIATEYGGDSSRIWREATDVDDFARKVNALPAFGPQKTDWMVGMLGYMGVLNFEGWKDFRVEGKK
jgi:uncharacterized HhH-GPD family protein